MKEVNFLNLERRPKSEEPLRFALFQFPHNSKREKINKN